VFSGAVAEVARDPDGARDFLAFIASPAAHEIVRRNGMAPMSA